MSREQMLLELIAQCYKTAEDKGWYDKGEPSIPERIALMHSELSEALEHYRMGRMDTFFEAQGPNGSKPDGYLVELADVVIRMFDHVGRLGKSAAFVEALRLKMEYNETRPYRHGGKLA